MRPAWRRPELAELLAVFALSEPEQGAYFPVFDRPVWAEDGVFQIETRDARFIALCFLKQEAKKGEAFQDAEFASLCSDICSLASLMIESTYDWLYRHPSEIANDDGRVIPEVYGVWSVLRRLCREGLASGRTPETIPSFDEVFGRFIFR